MGKKKANGEYNDFLDGEKLRDNAEVRTTLNVSSSASKDISPLPVRPDRKGGKRHGRGQAGSKNPPLTHFLCLPLVTHTSRPQLQAGLEKLKSELETEGLVPLKAVRPVGTLHLTLGVMSLDESKQEEAMRYLQDFNLHTLLRDITLQKVAEKAAEDGTIAENLNAAAMPDTETLTIDLEALVPMQAPQKTSILYAAPHDPTQRLQPFASAMRARFIEKGFLVEDTRPLKLHATIINTIYAKPGGRGKMGRSRKVKETFKHIEHDENASTAGTVGEQDDADTNKLRAEGHGPDAKNWMRFDARTLIERYKDFTWAQDIKIDRVQICKMGAKKIWNSEIDGEGDVVDEQYEVVCEKGLF